MRIKKRSAALVLTVVLALVAGACGGDDDDDGGASGGGTSQTTAAGSEEESDGVPLKPGFVNGGGDNDGEPVEGGELTFGVFSEAANLDPVTSPGTGYAGGTEMAAIYDVLMKYNNETGEYEPQMAESLEPNEDYTEWTLKLRDGVKFTNGEVLDAEAVKISLDRQAEKGRSAFLITENVTSIDIVDPLTVKFTLNKSWAGFPYVFAFHPGMITPRVAVEMGDDFAKNPIGAGPYILEKFAPGDEIVLTANPDYWAGEVNIKKLRFKYLPGAQANLDALKSGTFQGALLGEPQVAIAAIEDGIPGWLRINYGAGMTMFNVGWSETRPTTDVKIRQAIALATDKDVMNDRVWGGKAIAGTTLYPASSLYSTEEVGGVEYDPDAAKKLVEEAKAEGWDGNIEIVASATPPWNNAGLALQSFLQAVGMNVTLTQPATVGEQLKAVNIDHQFDISPTGYALDESEPYVEMYKKFGSTAIQNASGYKSAEMDALIEELAGAATVEASREVLAKIQELVNKDMPGHVWTHNPELLAWVDSVHGVWPSVNALLLFNDAWIEG